MNILLRATVLARDLYCGWCGKRIDSAAVHHRRLRSQGGEDAVENLVALCAWTCHNVADTSVHQNVREATERGFIVPSWADPAEVPLRLANGHDVLLRLDGTLERITTGDPRWGTTFGREG